MKRHLTSIFIISSVLAGSLAQAHTTTLFFGYNKRIQSCQFQEPGHVYQDCGDYHMHKLYGFKHGMLFIDDSEITIPSSILIGYRDLGACKIDFHVSKDQPYLLGSTDPQHLQCTRVGDRSFALKTS